MRRWRGAWRPPFRMSTRSSKGIPSLRFKSWRARSPDSVPAVREILDDIERWRSAGRRVAVARVVDIEGSGPRDPGAAMAVSEDGEVAGSVSGGCVEGAVVSEALDVLAGEGAPRMVTFGYSDDEAFAVGLTCGGTIRIFVEPLDW